MNNIIFKSNAVEQFTLCYINKKFNKSGFKLESVYEYTDSNGQIIYWRMRLKHPENHRKIFVPFHQNISGEFIIGEPKFDHRKKLLYQLYQLIKKPDELVIICEGEHCVDMLIKMGLLATTSGSADSADRSDWSVLTGRNVLIWPDYDAAGKRRNMLLIYCSSLTVW